ncbi:MAG: cob(I)yrinic acid a,c-diamide adenosyltransferase [Patescibacteria group bacterium]
MLYTRKGDGGTTKTLHYDRRLSKSSLIAEALGAVDELNSLLGLIKTQAPKSAGELAQVQQNLFIIQAELAGAPGQTIAQEKVAALEKTIDEIERELPPIKSFFIPGGTAPGAWYDFARAVARRAERRVVAAREEKLILLGGATLVYLNRLSSLLYALARLTNHKAGIKEESPSYK